VTIAVARHAPRPPRRPPSPTAVVPTWPSTLWLVRHGESAANVARLVAMAADAAEVDLPMRDVDVPLSARGERQADALGHWFSTQPAESRPTVVMASPYVRARSTAERIIAAGGTAHGAAFAPDELLLDERLREKELGLFFRLTRRGVQERYPDQWALRAQLGRFYYRPPAGESWCDVILRLRGAVDSLALRYPGERVMVVCHQVVILCFRYLLERMSEEQILDVARRHDVANCSVTSYRYDRTSHAHGGLVLDRFNFTVPLREEGAPVTAEPTRGE
jgi:broad specificity phosphatase PhoE